MSNVVYLRDYQRKEKPEEPLTLADVINIPRSWPIPKPDVEMPCDCDADGYGPA